MAGIIKICGNRDAASSRMVAEAGPDIMGWIFSPKSKRSISISEARVRISEIRREVPRIEHWAVFAKNTIEEILQVLTEVPGLPAVQVVEDASFCSLLRARLPSGIELIPALRVSDRISDEDLEAFSPVKRFVMDAFVEGQFGGTGRRLDVSLLSGVSKPWLLAGGLSPENVADAILSAADLGSSLCGVDVSSGVESGEPGVKDQDRVRRFIWEARRAFA